MLALNILFWLLSGCTGLLLLYDFVFEKDNCTSHHRKGQAVIAIGISLLELLISLAQLPTMVQRIQGLVGNSFFVAGSIESASIVFVILNIILVLLVVFERIGHGKYKYKYMYVITRMLDITLWSLVSLVIALVILFFFLQFLDYKDPNNFFIKYTYYKEIGNGHIRENKTYEQEIEKFYNFDGTEKEYDDELLLILENSIYSFLSQTVFSINCILMVMVYIVKRVYIKRAIQKHEPIPEVEKGDKKLQYTILGIEILVINIVLYAKEIIYSFATYQFGTNNTVAINALVSPLLSAWSIEITVITILDIVFDENEAKIVEQKLGENSNTKKDCKNPERYEVSDIRVTIIDIEHPNNRIKILDIPENSKYFK